MGNLRVIHSSTASVTPEQARDARARAWKFIFDTYRKKVAEQGDGKTKQKSLNTEGGGSP